MLLSSYLIKNAVDKSVEERKRAAEGGDNISGYDLLVSLSNLFLISLIFFIELYVLYYMIKYAISVSKSGPGLNIRLVLIGLFTYPMAILSSVVDKTAFDKALS